MTDRTCADCGQTRPHHARGLCRRCYSRHRQAGTLDHWAPTVARVPVTPHTCEKHPPGSPACYKVHACRCTDCGRAANRRKKQTAAGLHDLVDATKARDHIRHLLDCGYTHSGIAQAAGLQRSHILWIADHARRSRPHVLDAILAVGTPCGQQDGTGTRRRVQALIACGWNVTALAQRLGTSNHALGQRLRLGDRVHVDTAAKVRALYDELWDVPPPAGTQWERMSATRSRLMAERNGWAPPLAWDDGYGPHGIDNPAATPDLGDRVRRPNRIIHDSEVEWLAEAGESLATIADRLGVTPESVKTALDRHGRRDLRDRIAPPPPAAIVAQKRRKKAA